MADSNDLEFGITLDNGEYTDRQIVTAQQKQPFSQKPSEISATQNKFTDEYSLNKNSFNLSEAGHPLLCILTMLFKAIALTIYLFLGESSPVLSFIIIIVCSSLDFWLIKNIAGRLLVGLRWWNQYDQHGKQVFRFETHGPQFAVNAVDKAFFWGSQFLGVLIWGLLLIIKVFGLQIFWSIVFALNVVMSWTNLHAYYQCRSQYSKKIEDLKKTISRQGLFRLANVLT